MAHVRPYITALVLLCILITPAKCQTPCESVFGVTKTNIDSDLDITIDQFFNSVDDIHWTSTGQAAWIRTRLHAVWHTNDTGKSWQRVGLEQIGERGCLLSEEYQVTFGSDPDRYRRCGNGVNAILTTKDDNTVYFHGFGKLWATEDGGVTYELRQATFEGNVLIDIKVNPFDEKQLLALFEDNNCNNVPDGDCFSLVVSTDGGRSWLDRVHTDIGWVVVQARTGAYVYIGDESFYWGQLRDGSATIHVLYVCSRTSTVITCYDGSNDFFRSASTPETRAYNLAVYPSGHVFISAIVGRTFDSAGNTVELLFDAFISNNGGSSFTKLEFPLTRADIEHATRLTYDISLEHIGDEVIFIRQYGSHLANGQIQDYGLDLYTAQGSDPTLKLSLSQYYAPFRYPSIGSLEALESIPGAYIAQVRSSRTQQKTMISYDNGGNWSPLRPPQDEIHDACDELTSLEDCSLNIYVFNFLNPRTFVWTRKSAVGLVVARGNIGPFLNRTGGLYLYLSRDGGVTWQNIGPATSNFDMTNHGGVLIVAPGELNAESIAYSLDEGLTFQTCLLEDKSACPDCSFTPDRLFVDSDAVHPGFLLSGDRTDGLISQTILYHLNTTALVPRECVFDPATVGTPSSDYEYFEPHSQRSECILGVRRVNIVRKKRSANCFVPPTFDGSINATETVCNCTAEDFACDTGFTRNENNECVLLTPSHPDIPYGSCFAPATTRVFSSGYKKIALSKCEGGVNLELAPGQSIEWECPPSPCGAATPSGNDCDEVGSWGCLNATCCNLICACNPSCCDYQSDFGWSLRCIVPTTCSYNALCRPPPTIRPTRSPTGSPPFPITRAPTQTAQPVSQASPSLPQEPSAISGGTGSTDPPSGLSTVALVFIIIIIIVIIIAIVVVAIVLYKKYTSAIVDVDVANAYHEEEL